MFMYEPVSNITTKTKQLFHPISNVSVTAHIQVQIDVWVCVKYTTGLLTTRVILTHLLFS